jgi:alkylhydroperoxidase family enzyme
MAWIRTTSVSEATGIVKRQYDAALQRAGRVWNIVRIMSPNPSTLDASMKLYGAVMKGPSPLSLMQRELLATVVSVELNCHY